jgi:aminodeoxyfutalosine deaminase
MTSFALRARYVFPATSVPIPDGVVTVEGERIVSVGPCDAGVSPASSSAGGTPAPQGSQDVRDLGNAAILPGLVNAHVHLDFSDLAAPLGRRGIPFVDWIRRVMEFRLETAGADRHPVSTGLQESLHVGVTSLGDIAPPGWPTDEIAASPLGVTVFQELIAPTADRVAAAVELAKSHLNAVGTRRVPDPHTACAEYFAPGLSPHAPYSVHPALLSAVIELSRENRIPIAMHLAESREELELLRDGGGPLRAFLEQLGAWDPAAIPRGARPLDCLRRLAAAHCALVIHGNYLDDEEIAFLAANRRRMAVVYCPRTHDWFAHDAYPLAKMLATGVTVALGTDGRGSSPDLSLLGEMRFVARRHPAVGLDEILKMGTIYGARALGQESAVGSLAPGKQADLTIVSLPDRDAADPHELLFDSEESALGCYCRGVRAF